MGDIPAVVYPARGTCDGRHWRGREDAEHGVVRSRVTPPRASRRGSALPSVTASVSSISDSAAAGCKPRCGHPHVGEGM